MPAIVGLAEAWRRMVCERGCVIAPIPKNALAPLDGGATAWRGGSICTTASRTPTARATPNIPPSNPMTSDSPITWRTISADDREARAVDHEVLAEGEVVLLRIALGEQGLRQFRLQEAAGRHLRRRDDSDRVLSRIDAADRERRAADVGLGRVHDLLDGLGRDRHREAGAAKSLGQ